MPNNPELWNAERLERAMLDEAAGHGANKCDLVMLREQFRKAGEDNKHGDENSKHGDGDKRSQCGEIPS